MQLDNYAEIKLPLVLGAGETVVCDGTALLKIYDKKGKLRDRYKLTVSLPLVAKGSHTIIIDCAFGGEEPLKIEMQFKGELTTETCVLSK